MFKELGSDDEEGCESSHQEEKYSGSEEKGVEDDGDNESVSRILCLQIWTNLQNLERETAGC